AVVECAAELSCAVEVSRRVKDHAPEGPVSVGLGILEVMHRGFGPFATRMAHKFEGPATGPAALLVVRATACGPVQVPLLIKHEGIVQRSPVGPALEVVQHLEIALC